MNPPIGDGVYSYRKWEYRKMTHPSIDQLCDVGLEGWELVALICEHSEWPTAYLKRPILDEVHDSGPW